MLLHIPNVLSADEVAYFRNQLAGAGWADAWAGALRRPSLSKTP